MAAEIRQNEAKNNYVSKRKKVSNTDRRKKGRPKNKKMPFIARPRFADVAQFRMSYQQSWNRQLARMNAIDEATRGSFKPRRFFVAPGNGSVTNIRIPFNQRERFFLAQKGIA